MNTEETWLQIGLGLVACWLCAAAVFALVALLAGCSYLPAVRCHGTQDGTHCDASWRLP